ncbi:MAG: hypothetical protein LWW85_13570 [Marinilabiliales bacterium]|nr:hypothetical protein [Marinilabiliales bacterium]
MKNPNMVANSTMLFILATLWQQTFHELGHFVAAVGLDAKDVTLYHNYVLYDPSSVSVNGRLMIASAGPMVSLLIGLLFHLFCVTYKQRNVWFLFLLFISSFGYINFGGYLMMSPFFKNGDTGFVFSQLGFPLWVVTSLSLAGVLFLFFAMKNLSKYFVEMAPWEIIADKVERRSFISSLVKLPLLLGIVATVVLNLPAPSLLSLIYPLSSPFALFWIYGYLLHKPYANLNANVQPEQLATLNKTLIVLLIFTVLLNRMMVNGLHF